MSTPGLLLVFAEPGAVTEAEFADWYDNEHVPLRLPIPAFNTWTRYKAADGKTPAWAAAYDLESYDATLTAPYTTLAETRSEREKRVLRDMDVLERRTYEAYAGNSKLTAPSALFDPTRPARFASIASVAVDEADEDEFNRWYDEEHIPAIGTIPGWVRSRRFVLKDWSRGGVKGAEDKKPVMKWLAIHEYAHTEGVDAEETRAIFDTPWTKKVMGEMFKGFELRMFEFHKKWERDG